MKRIVVIGTGRMGGAFATAFAKKNVARGFDPRIACRHSSAAALSRQLGVRVADFIPTKSSEPPENLLRVLGKTGAGMNSVSLGR